MNINEYLKNVPFEGFGPLLVRKHVVCADGFTLSVQASGFHYCTPRSKEGPWTHFEVMLEDYEEDWEDGLSDTDMPLYARVPAEDVDALIAKHGGYGELK